MYIHFLKPALDFVFALFTLILLSPILLILLAVLAFIHKGSPIFTQKRIGQNAQAFIIYKLKTINKKGISTPFLQLLRNLKIDELPQLINILKFEMSFVGPRPDIPGYYDQLQPKYISILDLKPGITGYASLAYSNEEAILKKQINPLKYNDEVIFPKKLQLNLAYRKSISFQQDIKIILKTLLLPFQ
ncbi:sugar transferase [Psychroflexus salis]|uniref:Glycosyl transferase n=1 Tax=Psychroflexus salis TaxID=1526574 RepID=A0A917E6M8_9FLAO|nr:sugar transferase [Psychroflexus salis]GGE08348.1 glycosyl transferase [Psychroflexus salis]